MRQAFNPTSATLLLAVSRSHPSDSRPARAPVSALNQNHPMSINARHAITIPLWVVFVIALILATLLTFVALLLTTGSAASVTGKPLMVDVVLVLPLVWAAKAGWPEGLSFTFAFLVYFSLSFVLLGLFTAMKRRRG